MAAASNFCVRLSVCSAAPAVSAGEARLTAASAALSAPEEERLRSRLGAGSQAPSAESSTVSSTDGAAASGAGDAAGAGGGGAAGAGDPGSAAALFFFRLLDEDGVFACTGWLSSSRLKELALSELFMRGLLRQE